MNLTRSNDFRAVAAIVMTVSLLSIACRQSGDSDRPPPQAPTGVVATGGTGEAKLTWDPVSNATSYNIYWSRNPGVTKRSGTEIADVVPGHVHTGLTDGRRYYYVVTALQGRSESLESVEAEVLPVGSPTGVLARGASGEITVYWGPVSGADSYTAYWATSSGVDPLTGAPIAAVSSPHVHSGLTNGTTYYYVLTSQNAVGGGAESAASAEVSATPSDTGVPDPTFNGQGWVVHHNAAGGDGNDYGSAIALDVSGRILVAGSSRGAGTGSDMAIWRYRDDGILDTTLGGVGWVVHHGAGGGTGDDWALAVATDAAGRILSSGYSYGASTGENMVIWRYNDDGTLDTSFDGRGWVWHHNAAGGNGHDRALSLAVDGSGRIVAAGYSMGGGGQEDMAIWRYNEDGTLDTSFDGRGWVWHHNAGGGAGHDRAQAMAMDASGRVLTTGFSLAIGSYDLVIWRYNEDGTLDTSFNGRGWVTHHNAGGGAGNEGGYGMTIDSSGRILVTGDTYGGSAASYDMATWRYNDDGTLDTAFNGQGWVVHHSAGGGDGSDRGLAIAVDSSGRILVAGGSDGPGIFFDEDMAIWRYRDDGTLDSVFGGQGWIAQHGAAGGNGVDAGHAIATDAFDRILVAGESRGSATGADMVVWRYR